MADNGIFLVPVTRKPFFLMEQGLSADSPCFRNDIFIDCFMQQQQNKS
jgi:hypothetical protein